MKKVAINASNLHVGGGVQVACSFLDELSKSKCSLKGFYFYVSTVVDNNLKNLKSLICNHINYKVVDVYGVRAFKSSLNKEIMNFDLVFTVFGPSYFWGIKGIAIEGFAQSWIIDSGCYHILSKKNAIKLYLKLFIQKQFFKLPNRLVVELEHVKEGLIRSGLKKEEDIDVVYNTASSIYMNPKLWEPISTRIIPRRAFILGYLTRDYPHKNAKVLPEVKRVIKENYGIDIEFVVTFTEKEWLSNTLSFQESITNVGALKVSQCPSFYNSVDAVIFPSLMESFSATPLEAMIMGKPLFSSDRRFVKDICKNYSYYFDPFSAESIADTIAGYILNTHARDEQRLQEAKEYAKSFSTPTLRAMSYIEIIESALR